VRQARLIDVSGGDVFLRDPYHAFEFASREARAERDAGKLRPLGQPWKLALTMPNTRAMNKDGGPVVEAESKSTVESYPSDGRALGNAEVRARRLPRGQFALQPLPI
jgi:hypothetical protein